MGEYGAVNLLLCDDPSRHYAFPPTNSLEPWTPLATLPTELLIDILTFSFLVHPITLTILCLVSSGGPYPQYPHRTPELRSGPKMAPASTTVSQRVL